MSFSLLAGHSCIVVSVSSDHDLLMFYLDNAVTHEFSVPVSFGKLFFVLTSIFYMQLFVICSKNRIGAPGASMLASIIADEGSGLTNIDASANSLSVNCITSLDTALRSKIYKGNACESSLPQHVLPTCSETCSEILTKSISVVYHYPSTRFMSYQTVWPWTIPLCY